MQMSKTTYASCIVVCAAAALFLVDVVWISRLQCGVNNIHGVGAVAFDVWLVTGLVLTVSAGIDLFKRRWWAAGAVGLAFFTSVFVTLFVVVALAACLP